VYLKKLKKISIYLIAIINKKLEIKISIYLKKSMDKNKKYFITFRKHIEIFNLIGLLI